MQLPDKAKQWTERSFVRLMGYFCLSGIKTVYKSTVTGKSPFSGDLGSVRSLKLE